MSIILIRLDKIGDLIASLPVDQIIEEPTHWVIAENLGWIADRAEPKRPHTELSLQKHAAWSSFWKLVKLLRAKKPQTTIVFYAPWWVSLATWFAGVPVRAGRKSQWHSFVFFNRGLRQSRSQATQHEADYNRELVEYALLMQARPTPLLTLKKQTDEALLSQHHLSSGHYYVVHPGMFGSALNWPQSKYNQLIEKLIESETVVITGTKNDERFLTDIKTRWMGDSKVRILQDELNMSELLNILASSKALVAPSTGVLHLAAAMGVPSVGIYSPVRVHHPLRWGPRGPKARYILPPTDSTADDCMDQIQVDDILAKLNELT